MKNISFGSSNFQYYSNNLYYTLILEPDSVLLANIWVRLEHRWNRFLMEIWYWLFFFTYTLVCFMTQHLGSNMAATTHLCNLEQTIMTPVLQDSFSDMILSKKIQWKEPLHCKGLINVTYYLLGNFFSTSMV